MSGVTPADRVRRGRHPPPRVPAGPPGSDDPLSAAVEALRIQWRSRPKGGIASSEEVEEALAEICAQVVRPQADAASVSTGQPARPLLYDRLIEGLRAEILSGWNSSPAGTAERSAESVVRALSRLEEYRVSLWEACGEDLVKRLSDPDALELVVELVHDLRSPLNSILFLSEALRSGHSGPISEHQRSQLGLIYSATLGMVSVANDVMDTARDPGSGGDDDPVVFSISELLESIEEIVRPTAEEKGIALEFRIEGPNGDRRRLGFPMPLTRALLNLTTNGLKFTEEGQVTVSAVETEADRIEFSVADTGRGIPLDKLEDLFRPFHKSSYRNGHFFSGSGLGLSIARRMIAAMDGELRVESESGAGTRFSFELRLPAARG